MGLVGALTPTKCVFKETANGESIVTLTHPIDEFGRHTALQRGNILVVPVPVRTTPEIEDEHCVTTVWKYKVKPLKQLSSKKQRTLYKKKTGNGRKKIMKAGDLVTVVKMPNDEDARWKVKSKYGTGWIEPSGFDLVSQEIIGDNSGAIEEVQNPWTITDQYFRIYESKLSMEEVEVSARHISYDLLYNMTNYQSSTTVKLQTALNGILDNCYAPHEFEAFTNVTNTLPGLFYRGKNPIDALLNLEEGVCSRYGVCLVRDNYELFFLNDPGLNRGVRIQYKKNMLGIDFTSSEDEVATRIVPVGEKKNGDPLYLDSNLSNRYIDSQYINAYPIPHVYELKCENCKIGEKEDDGGTVTETIAKARMRAQARKLLEGGCDQPKISMKVEFVNLGDTEEYSQFKNLENLFLFDYVIVQHPDLYFRDSNGVVSSVDVTARIVSIEWDCVLDRMNSVEIGQVGLTLANTGISTWQIPSGFNGSKIEYGTVGSAALGEDVISARHIQAETVNAEHLNATSITAFTLDAIAAHIQNLTAQTINTDNLSASFANIIRLMAANITAESVTTGSLEANFANLLDAQIHSLSADTADIGTLKADIAKIVAAEIQKLVAADIQTNTLYAAFAHVMALAAQSIRAGTINVDRLASQMADIVSLTARVADVDYLRVKDLTANQAIITDGLADELYIDRLAVTSANMVNAVIGSLIVKGDDNKYYAIHVGAEGGIVTEEVTVSQEEIDAGETESGRQIVTTTVNAASLNGTTVKASEAILGTILTTALTAGSITAAEAMIASAQIPVLYTTAIRALGDTIDISANQSVTMAVGKAEMAQAAADSMLAYFSFDTSGMRTRKSGSKWSTLVGDDGFYIDHDEIAGHVSAFYRDKVVVDGVQIGDIIALKTEQGGWAWVSA